MELMYWNDLTWTIPNFQLMIEIKFRNAIIFIWFAKENFGNLP